MVLYDTYMNIYTYIYITYMTVLMAAFAWTHSGPVTPYGVWRHRSGSSHYQYWLNVSKIPWHPTYDLKIPRTVVYFIDDLHFQFDRKGNAFYCKTILRRTGANQAPSHYLNPWWPMYQTPVVSQDSNKLMRVSERLGALGCLAICCNKYWNRVKRLGSYLIV